MKVLICTAASLLLFATLIAKAAAPSIPNAVPVLDNTRRDNPLVRGVSRADLQLADWLLIDNRGEVNLAKYALEHSKNDAVKNFARQMVEDHDKFLQQLEKFSGLGVTNSPNTDRAEGSPPTTSTAALPNAVKSQPLAGAAAAGMGLNFVQIKQELAKQCGETAMTELQKKQGDEFDKCYIGMQLGMHMQMIDTLKVFKNHASPELAQLMDKGRETAESHFEHAQKIMKDLDKSSK